jgi:ABC-2 type transport system permease protein
MNPAVNPVMNRAMKPARIPVTGPAAHPVRAAVRTGVARGWIELKQTLSSPGDLVSMVVVTGGLLAAILATRHTHVPGTHFSLGTTMLVSMLGMGIGVNGVATMGQLLTVEREDGTLLRAKAIPHGMLGYLIGKVVNISGHVSFSVLTTLIIGGLLLKGLAIGNPGNWLMVIALLVLGLLATLPLGAVFGSLLPNAGRAGLMVVLVIGLSAISGIFYPITHLPVFLQWIGQLFPMYWLGLGMRAALLPNAMAAVEIGHSWRHLATFGVLSAWAVAGLVLAPVLLRRMARRESGSSVAARREKALRRI